MKHLLTKKTAPDGVSGEFLQTLKEEVRPKKKNPHEYRSKTLYLIEF